MSSDELRLGIQGRTSAGAVRHDEQVLDHAGDLLTFGADVPLVYEARETTHCVLLMAYP